MLRSQRSCSCTLLILDSSSFDWSSRRAMDSCSWESREHGLSWELRFPLLWGMKGRSFVDSWLVLLQLSSPSEVLSLKEYHHLDTKWNVQNSENNYTTINTHPHMYRHAFYAIRTFLSSSFSSRSCCFVFAVSSCVASKSFSFASKAAWSWSQQIESK